jgi:8-oxo-dGTP pyrophosphatase MutT (NUDIX family)
VDSDSTRWTVHGSRRVYASDWVNVDLDDVEIPGGQRFPHHVLRFPRVSVGAVVLSGDSVLLLWRHRFAPDAWGWEIPAGWCEEGEDPAHAARREIEEETGYRVATVKPLTTYHPLSGISPQCYLLFLASGAEQVSEPEPAEASRVEWIPLAEVRSLLAEGAVPDGPSLTALAFVLATRPGEELARDFPGRR